MATMGVPYAGEDGYLAYGAPLISDGIETGILHRNTAVPNEMFYTFSTGRFATKREWRSKYFQKVDEIYPQGQTLPLHKYAEIGVAESKYDSLKNIPIYDTMDVGSLIGARMNSDSYLLPTTIQDFTAQLGSTIPATVEIGNQYTFNTPRAISNWKYNKIAAVVKIQGLYRNDGTYGFLYGPTANIKNFLFDFTLIPGTYNGLNLVGYNLYYDIISANKTENRLHMATLANTMYNLGSESTISGITINTGMPAATEPFDYTLNFGGILIGSGFKNPNSNYYVIGAIGPESFEGIELVKEHESILYIGPDGWGHGNYEYKGGLYYWDKSIVQSGVLIEEDYARFALQIGLPVITSSEGEQQALKYGVDSLLDMPLLKDDLYYPIIANGKIDGERYLRGDDIPKESKLYKVGKEQDNHDLSDEDIPNVSDGTGTFDPTDPDENTYVDEIELNNPKVTPVGIFSRWYALTEYDVIDLFNFLYTADDSTISKIIQGLQLNGENPMDFFIGLRMFPFALNDFIDTLSPENIGFGNGVDSGVVAERITSASFILDLGSCTFRKYFNNFLDYEPYTTAKLYIPFCGEVNVETALFVGHTISVKMIVDLTTGTCCAVIYRDGIPCMYQDGNIASEVQITGTNSTEYVNMAKSSLGKVFGGATEMIVGAKAGGAFGGINTMTDTHSMGAPTYHAPTKQWVFPQSESTSLTKSANPTSGAAKALGGFGKMLEGAYEFMNMPTPLGVSGNSTALTELFKPQYCYFIVEQAVVISTNNYGNSYGYACLEYGKISALANGTLVAAKNVNITPPNATLPEISEIKELLESGVWK
ncbi:MAG: hypothetical protein J6J23_04480 [Clostridia bacterium]|nr:hypothetical protein [Clostridia bacterium]